MLTYFSQSPDSLYISEFQFQELNRLQINKNLDVLIKLGKDTIDINLRKMSSIICGYVSITIFGNLQQFHEYGGQIFAKLKDLFDRSFDVRYFVDLLNIRQPNFLFKNRVSLDQCFTIKIKQLSLLGSDQIFLSIDVLQRVKALNIYQLDNRSLNLVFEKLDIHYPHTEFEFYNINTKYSVVEQIYSQIPDYFDTQ
ncbi:hypothetical protein FGO68_gene9376 [Halteria grandinella]|uniref:Uncharacterized protein n=1 Tax=Halteria grandinella TaxID=5974 RepID=A0A8J8NWT5_HALGN|nr:hypothetical protein FGO68_gene9376 [Halteria grandinella]